MIAVFNSEKECQATIDQINSDYKDQFEKEDTTTYGVPTPLSDGRFYLKVLKGFEKYFNTFISYEEVIKLQIIPDSLKRK